MKLRDCMGNSNSRASCVDGSCWRTREAQRRVWNSTSLALRSTNSVIGRIILPTMMDDGSVTRCRSVYGLKSTDTFVSGRVDLDHSWRGFEVSYWDHLTGISVSHP